ncbi:MAG: PIN domain-containing protein [Trichodesmium sp.]
MKLYLDTSALNRIFDNQSQARIYLESMSMTLIFLLIENQTVEIVSSEALVAETNNNPYNERKVFVESVLQEAKSFQNLNQNLLTRAEEIEENMGIKGIDSLHLACAEKFGVDFFITCDDKLIKRYEGAIIVQSPTIFVNNIVSSF